MGIPRLDALRSLPGLSDVSKIWPFEAGFDSSVLDDKNTQILHLEIWAGLLSKRPDSSLSIRDQAQVRATVDWLYEVDSLNQFRWLMTLPTWLEESQIDAIVAEEGGIIGAGLSGQLFEHEVLDMPAGQGTLF